MHKLLLATIITIFPLNALAYPLYFRIHNPRNHSLFLVSEAEHMTIEIPADSFREFTVWCNSDFKVQYTSGVGKVMGMNLNQTLDSFLDVCRRNMGDAWNTPTVKYCSFVLEEVKGAGGIQTPYTLRVTQIRDTKLGHDSDQCKLSPNEKALKVIPSSINRLILTQALTDLSTILFGI